jgi:hypothetical protein
MGWLCRPATGGGFAVRQLYTDQDEVLFEVAPQVPCRAGRRISEATERDEQ